MNEMESESESAHRSSLGAISLLIVGFVLFLATVLGLGIAAALFLHWLWPSIDLGTWIIACVIGTGFSIHFLARTIWLTTQLHPEDSELGPERTVFVLPDYLPRSGRRPRRKKQ